MSEKNGGCAKRRSLSAAVVRVGKSSIFPRFPQSVVVSSCGKGGKVYGPFPRFPQVKATGPIPAAYVLQKLRHFHLCLTEMNPKKVNPYSRFPVPLAFETIGLIEGIRYHLDF